MINVVSTCIAALSMRVANTRGQWPLNICSSVCPLLEFQNSTASRRLKARASIVLAQQTHHCALLRQHVQESTAWHMWLFIRSTDKIVQLDHWRLDYVVSSQSSWHLMSRLQEQFTIRVLVQASFQSLSLWFKLIHQVFHKTRHITAWRSTGDSITSTASKLTTCRYCSKFGGAQCSASAEDFRL